MSKKNDIQQMTFFELCQEVRSAFLQKELWIIKLVRSEFRMRGMSKNKVELTIFDILNYYN